MAKCCYSLLVLLLLLVFLGIGTTGEFKWKSPVTWSLNPDTREMVPYLLEPEIISELESAFGKWSAEVALDFEYTSNFEHADIQVSFKNKQDHGDDPFDNRTVARSSVPQGMIHFNAGDYRFGLRVDDDCRSAVHFGSVALHEIGHSAFGLPDGKDDPKAVMYEYISACTVTSLSPADIEAARQVYGPRPKTGRVMFAPHWWKIAGYYCWIVSVGTIVLLLEAWS